jgi:hypothetical protein
MSLATLPSAVARIGETAGQVWHHLNEHGPQSISKLVKDIDAPRDLVMQALGWLAREDKLAIDEENRSRIVSLK